VFVSVEDPIHYFATVTAETFIRSGLKMEGRIVVTPRDPRSDWRAVSQHTTPLNIVVSVITKKSQNHYAEQLVKMIGAETKKSGSWEAGTNAVTEWLTTKLTVPANEYHQADGSGMSRNNRASANAFIHLLTYMWKSPYRDDFVSSLFTSGVGVPPLPVRIYSLLRTGVSPVVNAIGVIMMIITGNLIGLAFAIVAMVIGVVSFPLLLDRDVGLGVAIQTSLRAVAANPGPMAAWGFIVAAGLVIGSIPLFLGLIVVMPVLGHATWHLYRRVVAPPSGRSSSPAMRQRGSL